MDKTEQVDDMVTIRRCSNKCIPSDDDNLPALTYRITKPYDRRVLNTTPILKYTTNCAHIKRFSSMETLDAEFNENLDLSDKEKPQNENIINDGKVKASSVVGEKVMFLPRLNDTEQKQDCINNRSIDADYIRFPEIRALSKKNARLALNRSITDLLDPEMEILNKIKHMPRKKRKRRRKKFDCGTPV